MSDIKNSTAFAHVENEQEKIGKQKEIQFIFLSLQLIAYSMAGVRK